MRGSCRRSKSFKIPYMRTQSQSPSQAEGAAFTGKIYKKHFKVLLNYASGLCTRYRFPPTHAMDILQDAFLKIQSKHQLVEAGYNLRGIRYLLPILKHVGLNHLRGKEKRDTTYPGDIAAELKSSRWSCIFSNCGEIETERIHQELKKLLAPDKYEIFAMYLDGFSYEEIAIELGITSISTVGVKIYRAKAVLRRYYSRE